MVALLSGIAGITADLFAIAAGSAVSLVIAAAALSFCAALVLCRGRPGRRAER